MDGSTQSAGSHSCPQWLNAWRPGTDQPHRKPFVTEASVLKIEGRMFDKCDGPGMKLQPPGSLSKGNRSLPWTEMETEKCVEWLTSSGRELDYNKWGLTWPETWETPSKTSKCFSFRRQRKGRNELPAALCTALLEPWLLTFRSDQDLCPWRRLGSCEYHCTACLPQPSLPPTKGLFLCCDAWILAPDITAFSVAVQGCRVGASFSQVGSIRTGDSLTM